MVLIEYLISYDIPQWLGIMGAAEESHSVRLLAAALFILDDFSDLLVNTTRV